MKNNCYCCILYPHSSSTIDLPNYSYGIIHNVVNNNNTKIICLEWLREEKCIVIFIILLRSENADVKMQKYIYFYKFSVTLFITTTFFCIYSQLLLCYYQRSPRISISSSVLLQNSDVYLYIYMQLFS